MTRPSPAAGRPHRRTALGAALGAVATLLVLLLGLAVSPEGARAGPPGALVVRYRPPLDGPPIVTRGFDAPVAPWAAGHRGVDLASDEGAAVLAPAAGTVTVAGRVVDRGVVTIAHPDGRRSSLEPVEPAVGVGDRVGAGEPVGTLGSGRSHCAAPCLHWGVRDATGYVDPLILLPGRGPVVLLPAASGR